MHLKIVYKSYSNDPNVSHQGLAVAAINTSRTLQQAGLDAQVWPIINPVDLETRLRADPEVTHVVIQAPWIPTATLIGLASTFPRISFAVTCHSNVGFLQTSPRDMGLMLDLIEVQQAIPNLKCAGNSVPFVKWIQNAYPHGRCILLPNLYYLDGSNPTHRPLWDGGVLNIGIFGAPRPQKNVLTGVAGAIEIAESFKCQTNIWVNRGRDEGSGKTILGAAKVAIERNPFCVYKEFPWASWPCFRRHISSMHLLIQVSTTESFNQVSADGASSGVPSVVSSAIRWAPKYWQADIDDANCVAQVGRMLITNDYAAQDGINALRHHNADGVMIWKKHLLG